MITIGESAYSPAVEGAIGHLNGQSPEEVIGNLPDVQQAPNGVDYAVFAEVGRPYEEIDEALIVFNAFAQPLDESRPLGISNLLRGVALQEVIRQAGVSDEEGNELPVVMIASPSRGQRLTEFDRKELVSGDMSSLVPNYIPVLPPNLRKATLMGHSQGANVAMATGGKLNKNVDIDSIAMAEPVSTQRFAEGYLENVLCLVKAQLGSNPGDEYKESGYQALLRVHQLSNATKVSRCWERFKRDIIKGTSDKAAKPNIRLIRGMAQPVFTEQLEASAESNPDTRYLIGYGVDSKVSSPPTETEYDNVEIVQAKGHHAWPEHIKKLAEFTLMALRAEP